MSVITLVRHGQASYMEADYDKLSRLGHEQARKLGEYWVRHELTFDAVFHGPAKRHIQTMEAAGAVVQAAGLPWPTAERLHGFDEFDAFRLMQVLTPVLVEKDEEIRRLDAEFRSRQHTEEAGRLLQKLFEAACRRWCTGEFDSGEVESWASFRTRVARAIEGLRASLRNGNRVAVFTSAGPIAATAAHALDLAPLAAIELVWMSRNSSYAQFLSSGERFTMHSFNSIPHLDDLAMLSYR